MEKFGFMGLLIGALIASAPACAPPGNSAGSAGLPVTDHPLRGEPAPDFNLSARKGNPANLSAYAGRVVLLDFWATWCAPCKLSFPEYQALSSRHGSNLAIV